MRALRTLIVAVALATVATTAAHAAPDQNSVFFQRPSDCG